MRPRIMKKTYLLLATITKLKPIQIYGQIKRRAVTAAVARYQHTARSWFQRHQQTDTEVLLNALRKGDATPLYHVIQQQFTSFQTTEWLDSFEKGEIELLNQREKLPVDSRLWLKAAPAKGSNRLWKMTLSYVQFAPAIVRSESMVAKGHLVNFLESLDPRKTWHEQDTHRDVWSPYAVSQRIISLVGALGVSTYSDTVDLDRHSLQVITAHLSLSIRYLLMNLEFDLLVNHLWKNLVALSVVDSLVPNHFVSSQWLDNSLVRAMQRDFLSDGGHVERSAHYHRLCLWDLHLLRSTRIGNERSNLFFRRARRAEKAGIIMSHVDQSCFGLNDSWSETPLPLQFHSNKELSASGILPKTGYAKLVTRSWSVAFDAGALGPAYNPGHGHGDQLSIEARFGGHPVIVDPGVPTYSKGYLRSWCRSEFSHNGPTMPEYKKAIPWASFRVAAFAHSSFTTLLETQQVDSIQCYYTVGSCSVLGNRHVSMHRGVLLSESEELIIVDQWRKPNSKYPGTARLMFQIDASWTTELLSENSLRLRHQNGQELTWSVCGAEIDGITLSGYYPEFGRRSWARTIRFRVPSYISFREVQTVIGSAVIGQACADGFRKAAQLSKKMNETLEHAL